jgi:uncharacterized ParB-like nuclease family protein
MKHAMAIAAGVIATITTALHAQEIRMPFTNLPVTGPFDATAMMTRLGGKPPSAPCALPGQSRWGPAGAKNPVQVFYRLCDAAEIPLWMERYARSVRQLLGDPGRH